MNRQITKRLYRLFVLLVLAVVLTGAVGTSTSQATTLSSSRQCYGTCHIDSGVVAGGRVYGWITVQRDVTDWRLTVDDVARDGRKVRAVIVVDKNNLPDSAHASDWAGDGPRRSFAGPFHHRGTRGAKLYTCTEGLGCWLVAYVHER